MVKFSAKVTVFGMALEIVTMVSLFSRCCCRLFRARRVESEIPSRIMRKRLRRRLIDDVVGDEDYMPTSEVPIPIIVSVVTIFLFLFIGGIVSLSLG
jgi:hypothetical protein